MISIPPRTLCIGKIIGNHREETNSSESHGETNTEQDHAQNSDYDSNSAENDLSGTNADPKANVNRYSVTN